MSMEIGTATSASDLADHLNAFLVKGHSLQPQYTGTGNGLISGTIGSATSVQETITATFTSPTAFNVVGTVTGAMGSGTAGTLFTHARASFTIATGGVAWVAGDTVSFVMTPPWVQQRGVAGSEYIWKAPGNGNLDSIFVGVRYFTDPVGYYNLQLGGFTAYTPVIDFGLQPGSYVNSSSVRGPVLPLWNSSIPYWFMANGRRVIIVAKVSTVYESAYLGFIEQYALPSQWAYPMAVGGSMMWNTEPISTSINWAYTYAGITHSAFWRSQTEAVSWNKNQMLLRGPAGTWNTFYSVNNSQSGMGNIWPYGGGMADIRANMDGTYPLLPIVLNDASPNMYGRLDGIWATTGHLQAPENTITVGRDVWLVIQNIFRATKIDFAAVRMD